MLRFLAICAEIEDVVGDIYTMFASMEAISPALREFWQRMARDEEAHAQQIRFAMRLPGNHTFEGQTLPLWQAEQLLKRARQILAGVGRVQMTEKLALHLSRKLEEEFLAVHIGAAMAFRDDKMRQMLGCLGNADRDHVENLRRICKERGL